MTHLLTFTNLFPNARQPAHGTFVAQRLKHLLADSEFGATVVAPVPWFPASGSWAGRYGNYAEVPAQEEWNGTQVFHPRFLMIPKVGKYLSAVTMMAGARKVLDRLAIEHPTALIDGHYLYPDGVAAGLLARRLGLPYVLTARGTDVNVLLRMSGINPWIRWSLRHANAVVTVSSALAEPLKSVVEPERLIVLRNGVDLDHFRPTNLCRPVVDQRDRQFRLLMVGNLLPLKGQALAIAALASLPDCDLQIVGDGPDRGRLEALAKRLDVAHRVNFAGIVDRRDLPAVYNRADALLLPSSREGMANVMLEALACGVPVVGTAVGGTPEVITGLPKGVLITERSSDALATGVRTLRANLPSRAQVRASAAPHSWGATIRGLTEVMHAAVAEGSTFSRRRVA